MTFWFRIALSLLVVVAVGCGKKTPPKKVAVAGEFGQQARRLLVAVPEDAFAVVVLDAAKPVLSLLTDGFVFPMSDSDRTDMHKELESFLDEHVGLDFSKASAAIAFAGGMPPAPVAIVSGVTGKLKGGNSITLGPGMVVMHNGDLLAIGSEAAVKKALASVHAGGKPVTSTFMTWVGEQSRGAFLTLAGDVGKGGKLLGALPITGLDRVIVTVGVTQLRGKVVGEPATLEMLSSQLDMLRAQALSEVKAEKDAAESEDVGEAAGAIVGYYWSKDVLDRLAPTISGREMVLELPWELGDPAVTVSIVGILAAVAIPAFMKYIKKSKTSEARAFLHKLHDGARAAYADSNKLPASVGPTPAKGACCTDLGDKCAPDASIWNHPSWKALQFSVDDPHYYSYEFVRDGPSEFTVRAFGDLDCDGVYSTFEMRGRVDRGADGMIVEMELE